MQIPYRFMSQIDSSLVQIHAKFHDYSKSFMQVLFVVHARTLQILDLGQVQVMEFPWHL